MKETYRDKDNSSDEKTQKKKKNGGPLYRLLGKYGTLTDRSVRDVNETSNYVAHLISVTKRLVGTGVYFGHLTFTIGINYS